MGKVFCNCSPPCADPRMFSKCHPGWCLPALVSGQSLCLPSSSAAKTKVPLSLRRRSVLSSFSVWNSTTGKCVLVNTTCLNFIAVCMAKHDVHIRHFGECVFSDHVFHITTTGHCHIAWHTEQHLVYASEGRVSWKEPCFVSKAAAFARSFSFQMGHSSKT